ncbi:hypothetical protein V8G54_011600 [Vigna mungo]|uniref:Uncharacterized protein n=1 Tax=Vigna mungo TaxID=3915 RepID=A0AAQ3RZR7_VIGMU
MALIQLRCDYIRRSQAFHPVAARLHLPFAGVPFAVRQRTLQNPSVVRTVARVNRSASCGSICGTPKTNPPFVLWQALTAVPFAVNPADPIPTFQIHTLIDSSEKK